MLQCTQPQQCCGTVYSMHEANVQTSKRPQRPQALNKPDIQQVKHQPAIHSTFYYVCTTVLYSANCFSDRGRVILAPRRARHCHPAARITKLAAMVAEYCWRRWAAAADSSRPTAVQINGERRSGHATSSTRTYRQTHHPSHITHLVQSTARTFHARQVRFSLSHVDTRPSKQANRADIFVEANGGA